MKHRPNCRYAINPAMSDKRYLPLWLHRLFNGMFPGALLARLGSYWLGEPTDSSRHIVSTSNCQGHRNTHGDS